METHKQALGIESFGLSANTLEQVFIRVGEIAEGGAGERDSERVRSIAEELCNSTEHKSSGPILLLLQFLVLLQRYFVYAWHHKIRTVIPFVVAILTFIPFMVNAYKLPFGSGGVYDIAINANQLMETVLPVVSNGNDTWGLRAMAHKVAKKATHDLNVKDYGESDAPKKFEDGYLHAPPLGIGLGVDGEQLTAYFHKFLGLGWALTENFMVNVIAGKDRPDTITSGIKNKGYIEDDGQERYEDKVFKNVMATLTIVLNLSLAVSLLIFTPVAERSTKFKHQLFLTRVWPFLYWFAMLVGDFIRFLAVALLVFAFTWAFTVVGWHAAGMWPLWLLYFMAASMITYCASFIFKSPTKAFTLMLCWQSIFPLIAAVGLLIVVVILMVVGAVKDFLTVFCVFLGVAGIVFPAFPLSIGTFIYIKQYSTSGMSWKLYSMDTDKGIGVWLACLMVSTVIFAVVLCLVQSRHVRCPHRKDVTAWGLLENEDEDVTKERERLLEVSDSDLALSVRDLYKFFGRLCAVRKLTFGVGHDDCFGLLGVNGAGKTTTFDILTGVSYQSSGSATVEGVNVSNRPTIGYCPQ
ncbi:CRE-CED-7 protein, partial [Aphelenchoides avenae]